MSGDPGEAVIGKSVAREASDADIRVGAFAGFDQQEVVCVDEHALHAGCVHVAAKLVQVGGGFDLVPHPDSDQELHFDDADQLALGVEGIIDDAGIEPYLRSDPHPMGCRQRQSEEGLDHVLLNHVLAVQGTRGDEAQVIERHGARVIGQVGVSHGPLKHTPLSLVENTPT